MIVTTKMSGFSEWDRFFLELAARNQQIIRASARAAAEQIVEHVKAKTPVGIPPEHMRDQVMWTSADETGDGAMSGLAVVGNELSMIVTIRSPYAHFVEFGTSKMPARPFFRPALDEAMEDAARAMEEEAKDTLKDIVSLVVMGPPKLISVIAFDVIPLAWKALT